MRPKLPALSWLGRVGVWILALVVVAAVAGPWIWPFDAVAQDLPLRLAGPSWRHPFGLDELGRDIVARVLLGARVSLFVSIVVVGVSSVVGTGIGALAGYLGGRVDQIVGRVMDVLMAFPGILLAIALVAALGPSLLNVVLALTVIGWVGYARLVRGQVLRTREFDYVTAARALGASLSRVLLVHVVPTALPAILVQSTFGMATAMLAEASLSFLGLGVQPPTPSWGAMINGGRGHLMNAPHLTIFPGLCLAAVVLGFNFLGDALRDALDPKRRDV
ncbi:MAG: ABC transporter permease [Acidobacteria bacterium]|nr:ABC transporter permease [Acidobacteriota bacterium]